MTQTRRAEAAWTPRARAIHGRTVAYRSAGHGPLLVLVHGIASSSQTWEPVAERLARRFTLVAPDLPGHGDSDPADDSSPAAAAAAIRDLLLVLGHSRATFAGHSLGGGVVMEMAYHFPELVERMVLVASGGLGSEVAPLLRLLAVPGAGLVMPLGFPVPVLDAVEGLSRRALSLGIDSPELRELWRCYRGLAEPGPRRAFIDTLRTVVGPRGQRLSARDRLYLASLVPTLIVWGERDRVIPAEHGRAAAAAMPASRLELMPGVGHFPHAERPERFAELVFEFAAATAPARLRRRDLRRLVLEGDPVSPRAGGAGRSPRRRASSPPSPRRHAAPQSA